MSKIYRIRKINCQVNIVRNKCLFQSHLSLLRYVICKYQHYIGHQSPCCWDTSVSPSGRFGWPLVFMTQGRNTPSWERVLIVWCCEFMPLFSLADSSCGTNGVGKFGDSSSESRSVFLNNTESSDKSPVRTYGTNIWDGYAWKINHN